MIHIDRLACPAILTEKAETWKARYLERRERSPRPIRPAKKQYAHEQVVDALAAMSHHKCFYCECRLSYKDEYTVDHHKEVSEAPELAFEWNNLYLCCRGCQAKCSEQQVPRAECLDPCDPSVDPADHLMFEDELILPRNGSAGGRQTIRKYKLDRRDLELRRHRQLKKFHKALLAIQNRQIREERQSLLPEEQKLLRRFAEPEQSFSLMFRYVLESSAALP